jgi:hypothetical protein
MVSLSCISTFLTVISSPSFRQGDPYTLSLSLEYILVIRLTGQRKVDSKLKTFIINNEKRKIDLELIREVKIFFRYQFLIGPQFPSKNHLKTCFKHISSVSNYPLSQKSFLPTKIDSWFCERSELNLVFSDNCKSNEQVSGK